MSLILSLTLSALAMSIVAFIFAEAADNGRHLYTTYAGKAIETFILVSIVQTVSAYSEKQFEQKMLGILGTERRKIIELLARTLDKRPHDWRDSHDDSME